MLSIETHFRQVRDQIHAARRACGRTDTIQLLAVSKTRPISLIREAWHAGQRDFGENYVQEGINKILALQDFEGICWHFIGSLQSNKTRTVAKHFHWVHSIDRFKIAQRLNEQRSDHQPPLNICLQVNISHEDAKSGITPDEMITLAAEVRSLPHLKLRGLMAVPMSTNKSAEQHTAFNAMANLLVNLQKRWPEQDFDTLSMGMSGDMEAAIKAGSTMVRIGTALFGTCDDS